MKTIIEQLKEKQTDTNLLEEIDELRDEISEKEDEIDELKERCDHDEYTGESYYTALGEIIVINKSGNLQLQQELDDFFELMQQKYL